MTPTIMPNALARLQMSLSEYLMCSMKRGMEQKNGIVVEAWRAGQMSQGN